MTNKNDNASGRHHLDLASRQAAERKLCRLFQSFGIDPEAERARLIDSYVDHALAFCQTHAGLDIGAFAVDEARADLAAWFKALLGDQTGVEGSPIMIGRAAYLMCDGPTRWPHLLLAPLEDLPAEFVRALRREALAPIPPSEDGDMAHQPYDAWSLHDMALRMLPVDRHLVQGLTAMLRRDGRVLGFGWRNTRPLP